MENPFSFKKIMDMVKGPKTTDSLPVPNPPDMMAIHEKNQGVPSMTGGPELAEGAVDAAIAGKPQATDILSKSAEAKGMTMPSNLPDIASTQAPANTSPATPFKNTA